MIIYMLISNTDIVIEIMCKLPYCEMQDFRGSLSITGPYLYRRQLVHTK